MSGMGEVWVIDDDQSIRWVLERALGRAAGSDAGSVARTGRRCCADGPNIGWRSARDG